MRIIHVKSAGALAEDARRKMEQILYPDLNTAMADLKMCFPNHVVTKENDSLRVMNRDGSITVAEFKADRGNPDAIQSNLGFGTLK
jgi:hypothetical protein